MWLVLLLLAAPLANAATPQETLEAEVKALHDSLALKDIASRYTRQEIERHFLGRRDLDNFIVSLFSHMDEADFAQRRIDHYHVRDIRLSEDSGSAEVTLEIEGPWFLFFTTSMELTEKWSFGGGGWRMVYPELSNLPVP